MKKILIIPILLMLLTACTKVEAPTVQTEETPAISKVDTSIKEENTEDGWIKLVNDESYVVGYKGKEISLNGKVVEDELFGTRKYFFRVSESSMKEFPLEFAEKIKEKPFWKSFTLYFGDEDVTDKYKDKEITIIVESIGILPEGNPHIRLKKLP